MSWCRIIASHTLSASGSGPPRERMRSRATIAPLNSNDMYVVARNFSAVPISCSKHDSAYVSTALGVSLNFHSGKCVLTSAVPA